MSPTKPPLTELAFTTNPGLEELACAEFGERLAEHGLDPAALEHLPSGFTGWARVRHPAPLERLLEPARAMRSIHHILRPVATFELPEEAPLEALEAQLRALPLPELEEAPPFRVTSQRTGTHPFTSHDLQREAGAVLVERFGAPVDLEGFAVNVRVDVNGSQCAVAMQLTRRALSNRYERAGNPRVALRANVAYACLRLARLEEANGRLLDPFCGSGTVLIEAGHLLPGWELHGSDWSARAVDGARENLTRLGLEERAHLEQADARHLAERYPAGFFDAIVTNPPYGMRIGRGIQFLPFYLDLLRQAGAVLRPGGRLVVLVHQRPAFNDALRQLGGFRIRHVQVVETSNLYPGVFVLERL
ncbi:methyltransferase [Thiohalorhabdus denitrificans]|uniref:Putative N6-adenine-specific DNA methylase n=1 Tax=Thiohalorhabdus denitrificans TaxID=381306 RepID=A0A1G5BTB5_9GAMM|nr:methyltransferase [Thiohalorhabdus denitrificans]SCX93353.1 putative N6-adenine-specific DNA methylase [Thiohalorhabdus denitrificans]